MPKFHVFHRATNESVGAYDAPHRVAALVAAQGDAHQMRERPYDYDAEELPDDGLRPWQRPMIKPRFRIELTDGQTLPPVYSLSAAGEAIRRHYGWEEFVLSDSYQDDDGVAWSAYATQEQCDDDDTGAHAPRITRINEDTTEMVTVETMPDCHRASHRAARNWGRYPLNGAERQVVTREEAEELLAEDDGEYNHIVRG